MESITKLISELAMLSPIAQAAAILALFYLFGDKILSHVRAYKDKKNGSHRDIKTRFDRVESALKDHALQAQVASDEIRREVQSVSRKVENIGTRVARLEGHAGRIGGGTNGA